MSFNEPTKAQKMMYSMLKSLGIQYDTKKKLDSGRRRCIQCQEIYPNDPEELQKHRHSMDNFVIIWYYPDAFVFGHISLEADGSVHRRGKGPKHDQIRDKTLLSQGVTTRRFPNEVLLKFPEVFEDAMRDLILLETIYEPPRLKAIASSEPRFTDPMVHP